MWPAAAVPGGTAPERDAQESRVLAGGEDHVEGQAGERKGGHAGSTYTTRPMCVSHCGDGGQGPGVCYSGRDLQTWGRTGVSAQAKGLRMGRATGEVQGQAVQVTGVILWALAFM